MPHHQTETFSGRITHLFAHRLVLQSDSKAILADMTPKGAVGANLQVGDVMTVWGETKPSELKIQRYVKNGQQAISIVAENHLRDHHREADPAMVIQVAESNGYEVVGEPRRKPKHFEVLGKQKSGQMFEIHIGLDGHLSKTRAVNPKLEN